MKLKKVVVLLLCIGIMAFAAACGDDNNGGQVKVPDFSIEVVATEGDAGISAANLLIAMLEAEDHTYNMENGNFTAIDDYANTETSGWVFYCNGAPCDEAADSVMAVGGNSYALIWGDIIGQPVSGEDTGDDAENTGDNGQPNDGQEVDPDDPESPELDSEGAEPQAE